MSRTRQSTQIKQQGYATTLGRKGPAAPKNRKNQSTFNLDAFRIPFIVCMGVMVGSIVNLPVDGMLKSAMLSLCTLLSFWAGIRIGTARK